MPELPDHKKGPHSFYSKHLFESENEAKNKLSISPYLTTFHSIS